MAKHTRTIYRGYLIRVSGTGNYYVPALGSSEQAATLDTAKQWIDKAIAAGELERHATTKDFTIGQRVQLHPATNLWMRGARYGTVDTIGTFYVYVRIDVTGRIARVSPESLLTVEGQ